MSDLGWRADGIARARAAGGVELERYRVPGFTGGMGVRRVTQDVNVQGYLELDPEPPEFYEPDARSNR
jgi:hypothetical protein